MISRFYSMLLTIVGYRTISPAPEPAPGAARDARNAWLIYKGHLELAHAQAAQEKRLGAVSAIEERLDQRTAMKNVAAVLDRTDEELYWMGL